MKNSKLQERMQSEGTGTISSKKGSEPEIIEEFEEFDQKVFDELQNQKEEEKPIKKGYEQYL